MKQKIIYSWVVDDAYYNPPKVRFSAQKRAVDTRYYAADTTARVAYGREGGPGGLYPSCHSFAPNKPRSLFDTFDQEEVLNWLAYG